MNKITPFFMMFILLCSTAGFANSSFEQKLQTYFTAYESNDTFEKFKSQLDVVQAVFDKNSVLTETYHARLETIDQYALSHTQAVLDLARVLQGEWEKEYLVFFNIAKRNQIEKAKMISWVGFLFGSGSLFKSPNKIFSQSQKGWQTLRRMYAFFAGVTAIGTAWGQYETRQNPDEIPMPPAIVLTLGVPLAQIDLTSAEQGELLRDVVSEALALGAGYAAYAYTSYQMAKGFRRGVNACKPARRNAVGVVAGLAAGFAADRFVKDYCFNFLYETQRQNLENEVVQAASALNQVPVADVNLALTQAAALIQAAFSLETFYNFRIYQALRDYQIEREKMSAKGMSSSANAEDLIALETTTYQRLMEAYQFQVPRADERIQRIAFEESLKEASYLDLEALFETLSPEKKRLFNEILAQYHGSVETSFPDEPQSVRDQLIVRDSFFHEFLHRDIQYEKTQIAQAVLNGNLPKNPQVLMLYVVIFLEMQKRPFLGLYAQDLLNRSKRLDVFMQSMVERNDQ